MKKYNFILKGLDCASCANKIQNKLSENKNFKNVVVNFNTLRLSFESEIENVKPEIVKIISELEPEVEVLDIDEYAEKKQINYNFIRLLIGTIIVVLINLIPMPKYLNLFFTILAYAILLYRTTKNSIKLLKSKIIDENLLITISCIGAYFIGKQSEGLMVIILYEIGKLLEEKAINNTRKSIANLMDIKPEYANLKHENHEHKVKPEEVNINDVIIVKQGEKIPLDGIVISGTASLNTASLTGESKLRDVKENDKVISGSINEKGLIEVKVTEKYENSTVRKILDLVENATDKKAKTETFVNKASRIYTPIVIVLALIVGIFLPLIFKLPYQEGIYRALIFLVVSCPCAIVISVPLSYFTGIGKASKNGILIKGSNYLDALKDVNQIVFDKTGTLTKGEFGVEKIETYSDEYTKEQVLEYAAFGEINSNHPIGNAILKEYGKQINNSNILDFEEVSGKGLIYKINNKTVKIGNYDLVETKKVDEIGTVIYVKVEDKVIGYILLNDILKPEAKETIRNLRNLRILTKMFTGDNKDIGLKIGNELKLDEVKTEMLPQDKYNELEKLIKQNSREKVAFVGDGINDSPVLAISDIGISMGGIGASSAIEASDVVIMTDDLNKIETAIEISKRTNKIIKQNLLFALLIKIVVLILSVAGISEMWEAVFADVGVTLITIFNTLRILK